MKIENHSKIVSDEVAKQIEDKLNDNQNEILKEVRLRKGETDVRQLSEADFKQAIYRYMNDSLNGMNLMIQTLLDINLILMEGLSANKKKRVMAMLDGINKKENKTNGKEVKEETSQETNEEEIKVGLTD
jgi:hypothetical protein